MSMKYIRNYYGVNPKRGQQIEVNGRAGRITGTDGAYLRVRFIGFKKSINCHPTWMVNYNLSFPIKQNKLPERVS